MSGGSMRPRPRRLAPRPGGSDRFPLVIRAAVVLLTAVPLVAWGAKVETWRQDSAAAFAKGQAEGVVISNVGRVRLARVLQPGEGLDVDRVWSLTRTPDGAVYAATGDRGQVFRRDANGETWDRVFQAGDTQALALAALPDGRVFVGTGPSGQVIEVTHPEHPAARPGPEVQYVWALAAGSDGALYAATGPNGQLWKRSAAGQWSLLFTSKHAHLLCVAIGPDGSVFAGSDGEGLIYRVDPEGQVSVVYDAPQSEVRALLVAPDGALYAGTAEEAGGGGGRGGEPPSQTPIASPRNGSENASSPSEESEPRVAAGQPPEAPARAEPLDGPPAPAGTATPQPTRPGENAIYRIGDDGAARELFRGRVLINALAWHDGRLLAGTGPNGELVEIRDLGRQWSPIARLDHGHILALLSSANGDVLIGASDPGAVLTLRNDHRSQGTLTSEVYDTGLTSRFGALTWRAETPEGTAVAVQVRSGNVGEPDATWSGWSEPRTDPESSQARVPPGRFVQYWVTLTTRDPAVSPEVQAVILRYQTVNLPPELAKIEVPDLSEGDGATRKTSLALKWDASDPNDDDLSFTLHIHKEGWPDWVTITDTPLTEPAYTWDTTAVPSGRYRLRVTASDRLSNPPDQALGTILDSEPFLVDHQAPTVAITTSGREVQVELEDDLTRLVRAEYSVNSGEWVPIFPDDGLFDSRRETITLALPELAPGTHVLMVRTWDAAGNVGAGDAVLTVP